MIAPCVDILRRLARHFKQMLGTDLGTAHQAMDLSHDLPDLMASLEDHEVYIYKHSRRLDEDDPPTKDIITAGLVELISGKTSPLIDYNLAFKALQSRRRLSPLVPVPAIQPNQQPNSTMTDSESELPPLFQIVEDSESGLTLLPVEEDEGSDPEEVEDPGDFLRSFEENSETRLSLESAADVSLDMDAEDLLSLQDGEGESDEDGCDIDDD
jgi:hypothetical protein